MATLHDSTTVAAAVAPYYSDNYTQRTVSSAYKVPADSMAEFQTWKDSQGGKQWYKTTDDNTLKYFAIAAGGSVPAGAIAIDDTELNVVYASLEASLQQSLVDFAMSRAADEMLQTAGFASARNFLNQIPEVNVDADLSSLSQSDLLALLKQLAQVSQTLRSSNASGDAQDLQSKAAQLGLSLNLLSQSLALQATFDAQTEASEELDGDGTDDADLELNNAFKSAIDNLVGDYQSEVDAAKLAFEDSAAAQLPSEQLTELTRTAFKSLLKSLQASADLGFLATTAELQFGRITDTIQTTDGFVLNTAAAGSRATQAQAVKDVLEEALNDPDLKTNFADALADNADVLNTGDLPLPQQTQLYNEIAAALIDAVKEDPATLDRISATAVESGARFFDLLKNEIEGAANQETAEQLRFT
ncbi:MAG: hypothetical protein VW840_07725 [Gammaproteobacteria bacterium]